MTLSWQLLWNYWSICHETWYVDRTSYGVRHIGRKFWSPHFCGSYAPWSLENIFKSTNNLSFLCQFFINEITASDAGPDIIRCLTCFFREGYSCFTTSIITWVGCPYTWSHSLSVAPSPGCMGHRDCGTMCPTWREPPTVPGGNWPGSSSPPLWSL